MFLSSGVPADGATFIESGMWSISVPNLIVIVVMLVLFVLALVLPFPGSHEDVTEEDR